MPAASKTVLETVGHDVSPKGYLDYREYLAAAYRHLKAKLESYSYVQFAEDLGFSKTNVIHLVIQGKRPLSTAGAERVIQALGFGASDRDYFEALVGYCNARSLETREQLFKRLLSLKARALESPADKSKLAYFSAWYHPAIRELTALPGFKSDPEWIAKRLKPQIRPEQARKSLELLSSLGLIQFDATRGRHVSTNLDVSTGDEIESIAIVRFHQSMIELGREAITATAETERDISALTFSADPDLAAKIKAEIQAFRKRLLALASESGGEGEVFQLNFQFFPLTAGRKRKTPHAKK